MSEKLKFNENLTQSFKFKDENEQLIEVKYERGGFLEINEGDNNILVYLIKEDADKFIETIIRLKGFSDQHQEAKLNNEYVR